MTSSARSSGSRGPTGRSWPRIPDQGLPHAGGVPPAYRQTIDRCLADRSLADRAWLVCDWNCAGMASDLAWAMADPARLERLVRDVRLLAHGCAASVLYLDGDIETAIRRAALQRGPEWVARMVRIPVDHGVGPGRGIDRIVANEQDCRPVGERDRHSLAVGGCSC